MDYKIITGANDAYILTLLDFVKQYYHQNMDPNNLLVYDLGLSENNIELLKNINHGFTIKKFDYTKYPEYVNLKNYKGLHCSYAFKPIILYNEAQLSKKPIIWMDCANRFSISIIKKIIDTIKNQGFYSPVSNNENTIESIELNHPKTCERIGITEFEHVNLLKSRSGNIIGFDYLNNTGKHIIDEFYKNSLVKEIIIPEGSSRNNHRQDQTVLSILMFLYEKENNIKFETSTFEISHWNKKDPPIIENNYYKFGLINKTTNRQIAIIYALTIEEAIKIYSDRKKTTIPNFLNEYHVYLIN